MKMLFAAALAAAVLGLPVSGFAQNMQDQGPPQRMPDNPAHPGAMNPDDRNQGGMQQDRHGDMHQGDTRNGAMHHDDMPNNDMRGDGMRGDRMRGDRMNDDGMHHHDGYGHCRMQWHHHHRVRMCR